MTTNSKRSPRSIQLQNGVELPLVGLGTFKSHGQDLRNTIKRALAIGVRHIDTAAVYKNESEIADALEEADIAREDVFITSKIGPHQHGTEKATLACEEILTRLRVDYLDLLLIHWPGVAKMDVKSVRNSHKRLETWRVVEDLYKAGRCKAIGVSNYEEGHLAELLEMAEIRPMVNQIEVHPRFQQTRLRTYCDERELAVIAYASLGCGDLLSHDVVLKVAESHGKTAAQVLLRWGLQQGCAVIPKTVHEKYVEQYSEEALLSWQLSDDDMELLNVLEDGHKYCWNPAPIQ
ncbi:Aldo/keto reductase [Coccomyxa subellipsoidea C-169]|uniref:Aldo/keto reductase n=1 Tax=Coccomyxa subellipsoidea (strain C-169) TaxID=574566 RepID=I0Z0P8_COCSC|nr:Aldo/keto reductase [Coccomyxa subellipsoidea C-169]EIE24217.1 Aldo/keto reductase [Coccomyxa subellipsoidea C-169]|eukprot:XP_005648761.1 Aldo/keto reductase [Coccomyxa subellipsoidea C-169]